MTAKGFSTYERTAVHLSANQILNLDVTLTLGTTSSVIEVQTASPVINTDGHDIFGEISGQALQSMPEVGRHDGGSGGIYTYAVLTTGAAKVGTSATPIIQGTRSQVGILQTMDGIAVMAYPQGAGPVQPSMEGIEELKIESAVAPAEFPTAGNIQVVTKSGGNQVHGSAFWDYNGNVLMREISSVLLCRSVCTTTSELAPAALSRKTNCSSLSTMKVPVKPPRPLLQKACRCQHGGAAISARIPKTSLTLRLNCSFPGIGFQPAELAKSHKTFKAMDIRCLTMALRERPLITGQLTSPGIQVSRITTTSMAGEITT